MPGSAIRPRVGCCASWIHIRAQTDAGVPVELSGADPRLRFEIYSRARRKAALFVCRNPCKVLLPRGEYRVRSGGPEHADGERKQFLNLYARERFTAAALRRSQHRGQRRDSRRFAQHLRRRSTNSKRKCVSLLARARSYRS